MSVFEDRLQLRDLVHDEARLARFYRLMEPEGLVIGGVVWPDDARQATEKPAPRTYRRPALLMESVEAGEAPSPDGRWFASSHDGNLVLRAAADDGVTPLTTDGAADFCWEIEFPRKKYGPGARMRRHFIDPWSPDSRQLFAIKTDRRAVLDMPFIRYLKSEDRLHGFKIQRAGGPLDVGHPHVIDIATRRPLRFELGDTTNQYFTLIGWLPDAAEVLFSRHSRDFKTVEVLAGNAHDGSVRVVLSESSPTFVTRQLDVLGSADNHFTLLEQGAGFIWRSSRSGWNHLYHYGLDGRLVRALTCGAFPVMAVEAVDPERGWVYFTAHHDQFRPYDVHLCRVQLTGGAIERLTPLDGENRVALCLPEQTFTVVNSRPDRVPRTDLHACDGTHLAVVQQADATSLQALGYIASEEFVVFAADGKTELWGVMHKPADFDPGRKYPVIDRLYGGPSTTMVNHYFDLGEDSMTRLDRALAQLGYIVISVDSRGTPERSKAFQDVAYRNWGRYEIPDHAAAIRQLAQRHPFIDLERVGVWGHSWGGYFTLRALAQAPDLFRVGATHAFAGDVYDGIIYEPYLDLPSRAREVYEYASIHSWVREVKGKLLMVVGTADRHRYSNALRVSHALIEAGVDHEFVPLPDAEHVFHGSDDAYFVRKLVRHFLTYLPP